MAQFLTGTPTRIPHGRPTDAAPLRRRHGGHQRNRPRRALSSPGVSPRRRAARRRLIVDEPPRRALRRGCRDWGLHDARGTKAPRRPRRLRRPADASLVVRLQLLVHAARARRAQSDRRRAGADTPDVGLECQGRRHVLLGALRPAVAAVDGAGGSAHGRDQRHPDKRMPSLERRHHRVAHGVGPRHHADLPEVSNLGRRAAALRRLEGRKQQQRAVVGQRQRPDAAR
mmetsp:Transcript_33844/g.108178  ORF Transcript_33844/g.108178 Transcript_33844/m.108178 type:complete len:228 (-) Transcript_33844:1050-1733(-)